MKKEFSVFGYKFNTKMTIVMLGICLSLFLVLLGLDLNGHRVSWYGVLTGTGFLVALILCTKFAVHRGLDGDFFYDLIWFVFPLAIIGARLHYVLCSLDEFNSFYDVIAIWNGGQGIYGGIIGGAIGLVICCLIKKKNILSTMDVVAPTLILAQSIGRWGNFINKEVYGREITNKMFQWFPAGVNIDGTWHMATFFYESVWDLIGFFVLWAILRKCNNRGIVASSYLVFYGVGRFFLEGLREVKYILFIPGTQIAVSQFISIVCVVVGVIGIVASLIVNNKKKRCENECEEDTSI